MNNNNAEGASPRLIIILAVIAIAGVYALALLVSGCTPKREAPPLLTFPSALETRVNAGVHAAQIGGVMLTVMPTGSMEPTLKGGDIVVVDTSVKFEDIRQGWMLTYSANWRPRTDPPVAHWAAEKSGDGWIMDGEANRNYEKGSLRMTKVDFEYMSPEGRKTGRVVGIYRTRK